jgi:hypothetical protein
MPKIPRRALELAKILAAFGRKLVGDILGYATNRRLYGTLGIVVQMLGGRPVSFWDRGIRLFARHV